MRTGLRVLLIAVVAAAVAACRHLDGGMAEAARRGGGWGGRSHWEVTRDAQGLYRAYHVREARPGRLIVTVSETAEARPWKQWLIDGSPGASRRVTEVVTLPGGAVGVRYDHASGSRLAPPPGDPVFEKAGRTVAAGDGVYAPGRRLIQEFDGRQPLWTGFYADPKTFRSRHTAATNGLAPYAVGVASCVDLAGMREGDILTELWPWKAGDPVFRSYTAVNEAVRDRFAVGDPVRLAYVRPQGEDYTVIRKTLSWPGLPLLDQPPGPATAAFEARLLPRADSPERELATLLLDQAGTAEKAADLMRHLAAREAVTDPYRLPAFAAAHKNPWLAEPVARHLLDTLPPPGGGRIAAQLAWVGEVLAAAPGGGDAGAPAVRDFRDATLDGHLDHIADVLALAAHHHTRAFRAFDAGELAFLERAADGLLQGFVDAHMMCFDDDLGRQRDNVRLLGLAHRLDTGALLRQAAALARLTEAPFLASLRGRMEAAPERGGRIARRDTPWGEILLMGTNDASFLQGAPAALFKLGGDDFYAHNTGSSLPGKLPGAVLVDFGGDDRYENWETMRQGTGFMGVGILLDLAGNDTYIGIRHAQGTGFLGIGVLADAAGDDTYRVIDYGQGVGQFGAGLLLDDAGANRYEGHQSCQGVGFPGGVGLLCSAADDGADTYYNKGQYASSYRDPGSFEGWGQGLGVGHRPYASGGVGMLVDGGGDDRFEGGAFSQGGGYYYGLGILHNRGGDDSYRGSRYNMGFTAHQAVGVFLDDGGDDRYETSHYVALGMAWDESVTLFADRAGDDTYLAPGFAYAAAAQNGFALFIEGGGNDTLGGTQPARIHGNSYHGGSSLAVFLGLGGGTRAYPQRRPGEIAAGDTGEAFFVDSPAIEAAIQRLRAAPLQP